MGELYLVLEKNFNEKIRKLATSGKLGYPTLERFIARERSLGYPIKYSKPIGFRKKR